MATKHFTFVRKTLPVVLSLTLSASLLSTTAFAKDWTMFEGEGFDKGSYTLKDNAGNTITVNNGKAEYGEELNRDENGNVTGIWTVTGEDGKEWQVNLVDKNHGNIQDDKHGTDHYIVSKVDTSVGGKDDDIDSGFGIDSEDSIDDDFLIDEDIDSGFGIESEDSIDDDFLIDEDIDSGFGIDTEESIDDDFLIDEDIDSGFGIDTEDNDDDNDDVITDIPDEQPPLVDLPDEETPKTETPVVDIPDEDVPLEETPVIDIPEEDVPLEESPVIDIPEEDVPLADIPDEDVPLADIPKTGDPMLLYALASAASGAGLVYLNLKRKKDAE